MHLEDQAIEEFIKIYEKEFGERLTIADARVMAIKLIDLIELITKTPGDEGHLENPSITNPNQRLLS